MKDTIFAAATAPGRAAISVIRICGPATGPVLESLCSDRPAARKATVRRLRNPLTGDILDSALVLWFPGPASFTGDDMAELHIHGGWAVQTSLFDVLAAFSGVRGAEPGEFTRRAFENGKLDLTEAEAIADLVDAETRAQQTQALRQLDGVFGRLVEGWRERLLAAQSRLEAELDFSDQDLPEDVAAGVAAGLRVVAAEIGGQLADGRCGERLRDGLSIAILGPPNSGKSSLLNALARRDAAIVSERAGTTRDVIEVHLDLAGFPVVLADTAGLRASDDMVEDEGVRRAHRRARQADLKIFLFEAADWPDLDPDIMALADESSLIVLNKIDLCLPQPAPLHEQDPRVLSLSVHSGAGMDALLATLSEDVKRTLRGAGGALITRARHRSALEDCQAALQRTESAALPELMAEDVRLAARALGRITGRIDVEDVLDRIFRDFCIGK